MCTDENDLQYVTLSFNEPTKKDAQEKNMERGLRFTFDLPGDPLSPVGSAGEKQGERTEIQV